MASNKFFSGRIPNELYEQAEKHCEETGNSKTEVLIKALSTYLNFPIAIPGKNLIAPAPEVTKEMFEKLEERLKILEDSLKVSPSIVIKSNNTDNEKGKMQEIDDDNVSEDTDNRIDNNTTKVGKHDIIKSNNKNNNKRKNRVSNTSKTIDDETDNNTTKTEKSDVIKTNNNCDNEIPQIKLDNPTNQSETLENLQELPKFEEIITADVVKKVA